MSTSEGAEEVPAIHAMCASCGTSPYPCIAMLTEKNPRCPLQAKRGRLEGSEPAAGNRQIFLRLVERDTKPLARAILYLFIPLLCTLFVVNSSAVVLQTTLSPQKADLPYLHLLPCFSCLTIYNIS